MGTSLKEMKDLESVLASKEQDLLLHPAEWLTKITIPRVHHVTWMWCVGQTLVRRNVKFV